jgi:hypothetical protein
MSTSAVAAAEIDATCVHHINNQIAANAANYRDDVRLEHKNIILN